MIKIIQDDDLQGYEDIFGSFDWVEMSEMKVTEFEHAIERSGSNKDAFRKILTKARIQKVANNKFY